MRQKSAPSQERCARCLWAFVCEKLCEQVKLLDSARIDFPLVDQGEIRSMKNVVLAVKSIISYLPYPPTTAHPTFFWEAIRAWGNDWMWGSNLLIMGDLDWVAALIADYSCIAVTDGSYMKEMYPHPNLAAFVLECSKGQGKLMHSFVGHVPDAGSYRGELLGLMVIHLILWGVNKVCRGLQGSVHILPNCLGALDKVKHLPPYQIPTQCSHSDILKNIKINCRDLSSSQIISHVKANQDNHSNYASLLHGAQLNCQMSYHRDTFYNPDTTTTCFPLEPLFVFLGENKLTSDRGDKLWFWVQKQLSRAQFHKESACGIERPRIRFF